MRISQTLNIDIQYISPIFVFADVYGLFSNLIIFLVKDSGSKKIRNGALIVPKPFIRY